MEEKNAYVCLKFVMIWGCDKAFLYLTMCILTFSTVPLGGTVGGILVNISEHKHADAFLLTGDDYYNDRIKKTTTKDRAESCYEGDWLERCKWINLTFVGDDMVRVDIRVINETMAVIYKVYAYCIGAINRCSHLPLKEFAIGLQGRLLISLYF